MAVSREQFHTLIIVWTLTSLAMLLMALRLIMRRIRKQKLDLSDKLTIVCMVCLLTRCGLIHVVIIWGTNSIPPKVRAGMMFSSTDIYRRELGSKLKLFNRLFYNTYLWLQKCVLLLLYQRILSVEKRTGKIVNACWVTLAATYIAIQVANFMDCRPLHLYWQMSPDPGTCSQAMVSLLTVGILNISTDIMLIALPIPMLLKIKSLGYAKFRIIFLFTLGIFLVAITVIRLPFNFKDLTFQEHLTNWASVEVFVAAFVANTPTLYALRKPRPCANEQAGYPPREIHHDETPKSASGNHPTNYEHKPTTNIPTKTPIPMQEPGQARLTPPVRPDCEIRSVVMSKAQIGDEKKRHAVHECSNTMEWMLGEQINQGVAQKAKITDGKVKDGGEDVKRYTFDGQKESTIRDHMELTNFDTDGNTRNVQESPDCDVQYMEEKTGDV